MECAPSPRLSLTLKVRSQPPYITIKPANLSHSGRRVFLIHDSYGQPQTGSLMMKLRKKILSIRNSSLCVCSGGGAGNEPGGGASSVQLQVDHLLLRPAAVTALLQRSREDRQTTTHLGAHIHVRGRPNCRPNDEL